MPILTRPLEAAATAGDTAPRWTVDTGEVLFAARHRTRRYAGAVDVCVAHDVDEVVPVLERVRGWVAEGYHAAGFLAYEAAPAFDAALRVHAPAGVPLAWFGIYDAPESGVLPRHVHAENVRWAPSLEAAEYREAIRRIRHLIAAGDTYQVNFTFPLHGACPADADAFFVALCRNQWPQYAAHLNTGTHRILSCSPELLFRQDGGRVQTRPMKGTWARGLWAADDDLQGELLRTSPKDRAENVMIVDLLRNDLGKIARPGTVRVENLFTVERYPTLWQMTSTISAETDEDVDGVIAALFPSGSVTGAPKVRTMEIIRELEPGPRGVYCGAIGWWAPGRQAEFSVAIRTCTIDTHRGVAAFPVGSGVTWNSDAETEFGECFLKADVLERRAPAFELLESLLFDGEYFLLRLHLARLEKSAEYFGFPVEIDRWRDALGAISRTLPPQPHKVRLRVASDGSIASGATRIHRDPAGATVAFAARMVDTDNRFLYHKTTNRSVYENARDARPDVDDVILLNGDGEVTESTIANVAIQRGETYYTPPVSSGLLPGVFREHLISEGKIRERVLREEDVRTADAVFLINSVRKWMPVTLVD